MRIFLFLAVAVCTPRIALACLPVAGFNDFNCDGKLKFVMVGDSVVAGIGDSRNHNKGGYVLRLQKDLPQAQITSIGLPGYSSARLHVYLTKYLNRPGSNHVKRVLKDADFVLLDAGRNDYWSREPPSFTARNIVRCQKLIEARIGTSTGTPPFVALATLLPTRRVYQRLFIAQVNDAFELLSPNLYHVDVRFNRLNPSLISFDGIHPSSKGYSYMEKMLARYIRGDLQKKMAKIRKPDSTPTPSVTPVPALYRRNQ